MASLRRLRAVLLAVIDLSGHGGGARFGIGRMLAPTRDTLPIEPDVPWAADTGCFATPERYSDDGYLGWLETLAPYQDRCLFATTPDAWGDGPGTIALALPVLPRIRALGSTAALVALGDEQMPEAFAAYERVREAFAP